MNPIDHTIIEIHEEKYLSDVCMAIDVTTDCYGIVERHWYYPTPTQWEIDKQNGFFIA